MARCNCSGNTCNCLVVAGAGIEVSGSGTPANPYLVSLTAPDIGETIRVNDTESVNLTLTGAGTPSDPLTLSAVAYGRLLDLLDVQDSGGPVNGDVPVWVGGGSGHFEFQPPPTTPPGAVGTGPGLLGDGSPGNELEVAVSGVWGLEDLADFGADSTVGTPIYIDSAGELRARPQSTATVTWATISGKPATFPPTTGFTSTTAKPGNWLPNWGDIQSKPTTWDATTVNGRTFHVRSTTPPTSAEWDVWIVTP